MQLLADTHMQKMANNRGESFRLVMMAGVAFARRVCKHHQIMFKLFAGGFRDFVCRELEAQVAPFVIPRFVVNGWPIHNG
jgi:hypothetical protein